ncbi:MAG: hypothetical protein HQ519_13785 [Planctomycetes bacterium]|nr:hypothetical protein [Planctomycetota bacterium]
MLSQVYSASALGLIFACVRARDSSIFLCIAAHALFDFFFVISSQGNVSQGLADLEQVVTGMLVTGSIALALGLFLLWRTDSRVAGSV